MSTNDHIHEVKDNQPLAFSHVCCRGVAARAGSVHLIYSEVGLEGEHAHNSTILFRPFYFDRPPEAHNVDDIPPQRHNPLPARVEQVYPHTINNLSHTDSLSSNQHLGPPPGLYQANGGERSKVTQRGRTHSCHINRAHAQPGFKASIN